MTSDDFDFLDALDETDALGELLGTSEAGTAPAAPREQASEPRPAGGVAVLLRQPAARVLRELPWTGVAAAPSAADDTAASGASPAEPAAEKTDRGDNYLQSISW